MSKRYAVLGLGAFLALALAVPALGGPMNPVASISASVKSTANKALNTAKKAQRTATAAQSSANSAQSTAAAAQSDANRAQAEAVKALTEARRGVTAAAAAQGTANAAQGTANTAKTTADEAKAAAAAAEANANNRIKESTQVAGEPSASNTNASKFASASCGAGQIVTGGGYSIGGGEANKVTVNISEEQLYGGGWFVNGETINGQVATWSITAVAVCGTK